MAEYDCLPFDARKRLQNSKHNLCSACLIQYANLLRNVHLAITYMEGMVDGHDMQHYLAEALHKAMYQQNWNSSRYTPEYWDDREIDLKIKRDWYTQKMELRSYEYLRMPGIVKPTDFF